MFVLPYNSQNQKTKKRAQAVGRGSLIYLRNLLFGEENDTVPVVDIEGLYVATILFGGEAACVDTVVVDEDIFDGLGATLRKLHVVSGCTGVTVSITADINLCIGVRLHPLCHVVDVDHFLIAYAGRVDLEAYAAEHGSRSLFFDNGNFGAGKLGFASGESGCGCSESSAKVVDLIVESIDVADIFAGVVAGEFAATDVEVETADSNSIDIERTVNYVAVPFVAVEYIAAFGEEVDILAETEAELDTGGDGESPHIGLLVAVTVEAVGVAAVVPAEVTAESYEGNDREYAGLAVAADAVEHIPHDFGIEADVLSLAPSFAIPVDGAVGGVHAEAEIGAPPVAETEVVDRSDLMRPVAFEAGVFNEGKLGAGTDFDEPVFTPGVVVIVFALDVGNVNVDAFVDNDCLLSLSVVCCQQHTAAGCKKK